MFQISPVQTKEVGQKWASSQKTITWLCRLRCHCLPMTPLNGIRSAQYIGMISIISAAVFADPIEIPNAGFEDRETFDPFPESTDKYPQWSKETWRQFDISSNGGPLRIWNPGAPGIDDTSQGSLDVAFDGIAPEGQYVMLVRSRYNDPARDFEAVTQILAEPFDSTKAYTLTAQVGKLPTEDTGGSFNYSPSWYGYAVQFVVGGTTIDGATYAGQVTGGTVLAEDDNSLDIIANEFVTSTVIYYPNPEDSAHDGEPIQIRLCALENREDRALAGWVAFDDVTLQTGAVEAPENSIKITSFDYNKDTERISLSWASREGRNYLVSYSTDLVDWDADLDDSVSADPGDTTTRSFSVRNLADATGQIFFRVQRN